MRVVRLSLLLILPGWITSASAQPKTYKDWVKAGNAAVSTGQFGRALESYQQALKLVRCEGAQSEQHVKQIPRDSPCMRMVRVLFNVSILHKRSGDAARARAAYRSYLATWRSRFPRVKRVPYQERALFEIGAANFRLKRFEEAITAHRQALGLWRSRGYEQRAAFYWQARWQIAKASDALGRRKQALAAYQSLLADHDKEVGSAHQHASWMRTRVAALKELLKPSPEPVVPKPRSRSTGWMTTAITTSILAVASEAVALGLTADHNRRFEMDPARSGLKGGVIATHTLAGTLAVTAVVSWIFWSKSGAAE